MRTALWTSLILAVGCARASDPGTPANGKESGQPADWQNDTGADSAPSEPAGPVFVADAEDGLSVVAVEPERYLGVWYEIATTPSPQQAQCSGTSAEYSLREDGDVRVLNRCYIGGLDGRLNEIEGSASFVDDTYARLLVDFGFGFAAPYNIVQLDGRDGDDPYAFAVVSSPGFSLWILSRTPQMDPELYELLVDRAVERGFPADELVPTLQPE